jgi:thymidylate kinase
MRGTKLILVEGMPGTGKSTVSQLITRQIIACGESAIWCTEEREDHPLRLFYEPERHTSCFDYCKQAVALWASYARELHEQDYISVLDAAFLQNHVRSMMIFDCERRDIYELAQLIEDLIASLEPILIYLRPKDVEKSFRDIVEIRGQRMLDLWIQAHEQYPYSRRLHIDGYAAFVAYWSEFCEIADHIFETLSISKLRQHVSKDDWETSSRGILDFLALPLPTDSSKAQGLERFAGTYESANDNHPLRFSLYSGTGCLFTVSDQPTIDIQHGPIGCFRIVRLIPQGMNRFYVEAWPHNVEFTEDATGTITSMRLTVSEVGWTKFEYVYKKEKANIPHV